MEFDSMTKLPDLIKINATAEKHELEMKDLYFLKAVLIMLLVVLYLGLCSVLLCLGCCTVRLWKIGNKWFKICIRDPAAGCKIIRKMRVSRRNQTLPHLIDNELKHKFAQEHRDGRNIYLEEVKVE